VSLRQKYEGRGQGVQNRARSAVTRVPAMAARALDLFRMIEVLRGLSTGDVEIGEKEMNMDALRECGYDRATLISC